MLLSNYCDEDFNNPNFNAFEEGPAVKNCSEQLSLLLKNVPDQLKEHAVQGMMEKFGHVTRVHVVKSEDNRRNLVFVDFTAFSEASKAFQEINKHRDSGFCIRAEFARPRQEAMSTFIPEPLPQPQVKPKNNSLGSSQETDDIVVPLPICLDLTIPHDGLTEKVTQFERQKVELHAKSKATLEMCEKLSKTSSGSFNLSEGNFIYNEGLAKKFQYRCVNCSRSAILRCSKTGGSFCSINCSMNKREVVEVLGKNGIHRVVKLEERDKVHIVSVISENIVFVRQASDLDILTVTKIFKLSRKSKKLEMFPEVDDLALAEIDREICRVIVLRVPEIEAEEILVQLIDYGNTVYVKFEDLLEMNSQVQAIPCTAMKVNLLDVNISAINCDIIDYLSGLRDRKVELTVSQVSGIGVQLKDGLATSVNETIVDCTGIMEPNGNLVEIDYNSIVQEALIELGSDKKLIILNSETTPKDGILSCTTKRALKDYIEMQKAINWYGNNFTGESRLPRSNQKVCLAKVNGQWHRAVVMKAEGNGKPIMELIDLKSVQQVRLKNIILMPHIFGRYSIMSELCVVAGYKKIKETSPEFFQELKTISVNEVSWDKKNQLITLHFQQDKNIQTLEL